MLCAYYNSSLHNMINLGNQTRFFNTVGVYILFVYAFAYSKKVYDELNIHPEGQKHRETHKKAASFNHKTLNKVFENFTQIVKKKNLRIVYLS